MKYFAVQRILRHFIIEVLHFQPTTKDFATFLSHLLTFLSDSPESH